MSEEQTDAEHTEITTGYIPRRHQFHLHRQLRRFNVIVCHRRFGKTVFSINHMIDRGLKNQQQDPQYAYIAPTYGQAKRVAWDFLKRYTQNLPGYTPNEQDLKVDIRRPHRKDRVRIMLLGAENLDALRGIYLDGVILDEYASMNPNLWGEVIRPALTDREGWGIFIGTFKGQNHFFKLYNAAQTREGWYTVLFKASQTGIVPAKELELARAEMTPDNYSQEFECDPTAVIKGAYFAPQLADLRRKDKITALPHDPALNVTTAWDLGIGDSTAIWFIQEIANQIRVVKYIEDSGVGLDVYVKRLKELPYVYQTHFLPHDAAAREIGSGRTREETLRNLGLRGVRVLPRHNLADGINAVRLILPRCVFDEPECEKGLLALTNYQRLWNPKKDCFEDRPLHDWASHGADAFRSYAMGRRNDRTQHHSRLPRQAETEYDIFGDHK